MNHKIELVVLFVSARKAPILMELMLATVTPNCTAGQMSLIWTVPGIQVDLNISVFLVPFIDKIYTKLDTTMIMGEHYPLPYTWHTQFHLSLRINICCKCLYVFYISTHVCIVWLRAKWVASEVLEITAQMLRDEIFRNWRLAYAKMKNVLLKNN